MTDYGIEKEGGHKREKAATFPFVNRARKEDREMMTTGCGCPHASCGYPHRDLNTMD